MEILTIEHPRWHEFTEDLYELIEEGCTGSHEGTIAGRNGRLRCGRDPRIPAPARRLLL
jgi:hypothetical protein